MPDTATVRLCAFGQVPSFVLPQVAFDALDRLAGAARAIPFRRSPCSAEEATVLATWLDALLNDPGDKAERTELFRACLDFFAGGGGKALVAWLHRCNGFAVAGGAPPVPEPSAN
jgi:hypothetical protein